MSLGQDTVTVSTDMDHAPGRTKCMVRLCYAAKACSPVPSTCLSSSPAIARLTTVKQRKTISSIALTATPISIMLTPMALAAIPSVRNFLTTTDASR